MCPSPVTSRPTRDVAKIVADYEAKASAVTDRVVGYQRGPLTRDPKAAASASCETPMGDVIADAQLAATRKAGAVLALMNPGGVRADLTPPRVIPEASSRFAMAQPSRSSPSATASSPSP